MFWLFQARDRRWAGDLSGAQGHGSTARTLNIVNAVLLGVLVLIFIVLSVTYPWYGRMILEIVLRRI